MTEFKEFMDTVNNIVKSVSPIISNLTKGEIILDKNESVIIKTREKLKKESHFFVIPLKECEYVFKDIRSLTARLNELKKLKDKKLITDKEYEEKKKEMLEQI